MTDKQKIWTSLCGVVLVLAVVLSVSFHNHSQEKSTALQVNRVATKVRASQVQLNRKKTRIKKDLFGDAVHSKDPVIQSMAKNKNDMNTVHTNLLGFFSTYYDWSSNKTYEARPNKLKNVATPNVLGNKKLFDKGKDKTGGNYIDNMGLNSQFNDLNPYIIKSDSDNIDCLADVQYNSWMNDEDNQATGEQWFELNYNRKQHKITSLKPLYTQKNVSNSNN